MDKTELRWGMFGLLLALYAVYLLLKINGVWDYSARFHLERIIGSEQYNSLFLIDRDVETTWGILDADHAPGEELCFQFPKTRTFSKMRIQNVSEYKTRPVKTYISADRETFVPCAARVNEISGQVREYVFNNAYRGRYLKLEYADGEIGFWPITEVEFYE